LFAMALAVPQFSFTQAPPPAPPAPKVSAAADKPSVSFDSVISCNPGASHARMHPVDRHRALTKSLSQIKKQKLEKKKLKAGVGGADGRGDAGADGRNRHDVEPLPQKLPRRARQNEAMASTHRSSR
jgi:hypothetical protein